MFLEVLYCLWNISRSKRQSTLIPAFLLQFWGFFKAVWSYLRKRTNWGILLSPSSLAFMPLSLTIHIVHGKSRWKCQFFSRGTMNWDTKRLKIPENTANLTANIHLYSWGWLYRRGLTKTFLEMAFQCRFVGDVGNKSFPGNGFSVQVCGWCGCVVLWPAQAQQQLWLCSSSAINSGQAQILCCSPRLHQMLPAGGSRGLPEQTFDVLEVLTDESCGNFKNTHHYSNRL